MKSPVAGTSHLWMPHEHSVDREMGYTGLVIIISMRSRGEESYKQSKQLNAPIFSSKHQTNSEQGDHDDAREITAV